MVRHSWYRESLWTVGFYFSKPPKGVALGGEVCGGWLGSGNEGTIMKGSGSSQKEGAKTFFSLPLEDTEETTCKQERQPSPRACPTKNLISDLFRLPQAMVFCYSRLKQKQQQQQKPFSQWLEDVDKNVMMISKRSLKYRFAWDIVLSVFSCCGFFK